MSTLCTANAPRAGGWRRGSSARHVGHFCATPGLELAKHLRIHSMAHKNSASGDASRLRFEDSHGVAASLVHIETARLVCPAVARWTK
eukprot:8677559-Pyramimonas_sp.AAC.1